MRYCVQNLTLLTSGTQPTIHGGGQSGSVKNHGNAMGTAFSSLLTDTANDNTSHGCSATIQTDPKRQNCRY